MASLLPSFATLPSSTNRCKRQKRADIVEQARERWMAMRQMAGLELENLNRELNTALSTTVDHSEMIELVDKAEEMVVMCILYRMSDLIQVAMDVQTNYLTEPSLPKWYWDSGYFDCDDNKITREPGWTPHPPLDRTSLELTLQLLIPTLANQLVKVRNVVVQLGFRSTARILKRVYDQMRGFESEYDFYITNEEPHNTASLNMLAILSDPRSPNTIQEVLVMITPNTANFKLLPVNKYDPEIFTVVDRTRPPPYDLSRDFPQMGEIGNMYKEPLSSMPTTLPSLPTLL